MACRDHHRIVSGLVIGALRKINPLIDDPVHRSSGEEQASFERSGAAMRWMTQKWIVLKENETIWDVAFDAVVAVLGAAGIVQLIQLLLSIP